MQMVNVEQPDGKTVAMQVPIQQGIIVPPTMMMMPPRGFEFLAGINGIFLRQSMEMFEVVTGCEALSCTRSPTAIAPTHFPRNSSDFPS